MQSGNGNGPHFDEALEQGVQRFDVLSECRIHSYPLLAFFSQDLAAPAQRSNDNCRGDPNNETNPSGNELAIHLLVLRWFELR
jgi:hypothetical protein